MPGPTREPPGPDTGRVPAPRSPSAEQPDWPPAVAWLGAQARNAPLRAGLALGLGALGALALGRALAAVTGVLLLAIVALVLAAGLEPLVLALQRRLRLPRRAAALLALGLAAVAVAAVVVVLVVPAERGVSALVRDLPGLAGQVQRGDGAVGDLARRLSLEARARQLVGKVLTPSGALALTGGVLSVARTALIDLVVLGALLAITARLSLDLPGARAAAYRLVPRSSRAQVTRLADSGLRRVGAFVVGDIITSVIAGVGMWGFLLVAGVPSPAALGLLVGVADLVPTVGALAGGAVVALVALSVSPATALATVVFTLVFRQLEDYLIIPRVMARAVAVAPLLSVTSVLAGAALLGVLGALLAVPVAACVQLLVEELVLPTQQQR